MMQIYFSLSISLHFNRVYIIDTTRYGFEPACPQIHSKMPEKYSSQSDIKPLCVIFAGNIHFFYTLRHVFYATEYAIIHLGFIDILGIAGRGFKITEIRQAKSFCSHSIYRSIIIVTLVGVWIVGSDGECRDILAFFQYSGAERGGSVLLTVCVFTFVVFTFQKCFTECNLQKRK